MKRRKPMALILITLMLLVILTGCRSGSTNMDVAKPDNENGTVASNEKTEGSTGSDNVTNSEEAKNNLMNLQIGEHVFTATLVENTSTKALKELLEEGPITIDMRDYEGMEKVGSFGTDLPRNDEPITTEPGDLILYQGNSFVIYYAPNSWTFTRIGKINDMTQDELKQALGSGSITVTLSLV